MILWYCCTYEQKKRSDAQGGESASPDTKEKHVHTPAEGNETREHVRNALHHHFSVRRRAPFHPKHAFRVHLLRAHTKQRSQQTAVFTTVVFISYLYNEARGIWQDLQSVDVVGKIRSCTSDPQTQYLIQEVQNIMKL